MNFNSRKWNKLMKLLNKNVDFPVSSVDNFSVLRAYRTFLLSPLGKVLKLHLHNI